MAITNTLGLTNTGSPISYMSSGSAAIPTNAYRYQQPYLFQPVNIRIEPARLVGSDGFLRDNIGPNRTYVDLGTLWAWDNVGGDWIDATLTRMGSTPWASLTANAVSGGAAQANYSFSVTSLLQKCQVDARWPAFLMRAQTSARAIAGMQWPAVGERPTLNVTYTDASTATLACRIVAFCGGGTDIPYTLGDEFQLPVFIEFDRPTKAVSSATMSIRVTQHWSGGDAQIQLMLLDPPVNTQSVAAGLAAGTALDAGLVGNASITHLHRYLDGTTRSDVFYEGPGNLNFSSELAYDPAIFGTGATDTSKLPHIGLGKIVGPSPATPAYLGGPTWNLVASSYASDGFVPLATGLGAIRMFMSKGYDVNTAQPISDGATVGYFGSLASSAKLFLPEATFGLADDIYVRGYYRVGEVGGGAYTEPPAGRFNVLKAPGAFDWCGLGGKSFLTPAHDTTFGGVSGSSGGQMGWQSRIGWGSIDQVLGGPDEGGWGLAWHGYDYQFNQPAGNYSQNYILSDNKPVQSIGVGGMGYLYAHRWYCVEQRMKLNTVMPEYPGFAPDGILAFWIDGRKVKEDTGLVFRQKPAFNGWMNATRNASYAANQFSELAVSGMSAGKGYLGVCVRHNGSNDGPATYYAALVSRKNSTQAVIGLRKKVYSASNIIVHLALTDPISWADGDIIRIEANGAAPTALTVKKNGVAQTLKWYVSGVLNTGTSYSDATDTGYTAGRVGVHGEANSASAGLFGDNWAGGAIGGTTASDSFTYSDGALGTVGSANWTNHDSMGTSRVVSGKVHAIENGVIDPSLNCRPVRDLGHRDLWFNWFHGGLSQNNRDRVQFFTGLAVGTAYIGPMTLPASTLPAWLPAVGTIGHIGTSILEDAATYGANETFTLNKVISAYGSAAISKIKSGSSLTEFVYYMFGTGHGDTGNDAVYVWRSSTRTFTRLVAPSAFYVGNGFSPAPTPDAVYGERYAGRPDAQHGFTSMHALDSNEVNGPAFLQLRGLAVGQGAIATNQAHILPLNAPTWARYADLNAMSQVSGMWTALVKDTTRQKWIGFPASNGTDFWEIDCTQTNPTWLQRTQAVRTGNWNGSFIPLAAYHPVLDIYLAGVIYPGVSTLQILDAANPTGAWVTITTTGTGPTQWRDQSLMYRASNGTFVHPDTSASPATALWVLTPPATLPFTNAWTWSRRTFTGTSTFSSKGGYEDYARWRMVDEYDAIFATPHQSSPMECWKL